MSDPNADSALDGQEQGDALADSASGGQEQGDQSRVNGLMSLAQRRTAERDAALAEIESLRAQLDQQTLAEQQAFDTSQVEAMFPERFAEPEAADADIDPMEQPEPVPITMGVNPMRPDHAARPAAPTAMTPADRFAQDQADIATMKARLNAMGQQWFDNAKAQGLLD